MKLSLDVITYSCAITYSILYVYASSYLPATASARKTVSQKRLTDSRGNYLCEGYRAFFKHADPYMQIMADILCKGRSADGIIEILSYY